MFPQDANAKLSRQIESAKKQEKESRAQLQALQEARGAQDRLLEGASGQIDGLRREIKALSARQAARDQQLLQHVEVIFKLASCLNLYHLCHDSIDIAPYQSLN